MREKVWRLASNVTRRSRSTSLDNWRSLVQFAAIVLLGFALYGQMLAAQTAKVETVQFKSKLVNSTLPYNVVLPPDYASAESRNTRYPVLYLLHGLTGHYSDWTNRTKLAEYASQYQLIIVTPEGNDGWYTDSATTSTDKYESYIVQELIPDVRDRYRTIETREARAIAGLSMGGYGALKFAVKYPQLFGFAASMSGALGAASWTEQDLRGYETVWRSLASVFGPTDSAVRPANDLNQLFRNTPAERLATLPYIYLDCGTEDGLLQSSTALANILLMRKIPHEFRQLPGAHTWSYWDQQVVEVLRIAGAKMNAGKKALKATAVSSSLKRETAQSRHYATPNH